MCVWSCVCVRVCAIVFVCVVRPLNIHLTRFRALFLKFVFIRDSVHYTLFISSSSSSFCCAFASSSSCGGSFTSYAHRLTDAMTGAMMRRGLLINFIEMHVKLRFPLVFVLARARERLTNFNEQTN